jgi:hypothetical protein
MKTEPIDIKKRKEDMIVSIKKNIAIGFVLLTLVFFFFKILLF